MILICPPFLSTQWFPVHERRFATGVSQMSLYLGLAFGFIFSDKIADTLHDDGVHNLQNLLLGMFYCQTDFKLQGISATSMSFHATQKTSMLLTNLLNTKGIRAGFTSLKSMK